MKPALRILHLEDDIRDAELVREMLLSEGMACDIVRVDTQAAFLNALEQRDYELIFADYSLPAFDGISALNLARAKTPDIPFIFITGKMGEERAIETLKHGATDYILKDNLSRLVPSVNRALRESREKTEHKRGQEALEFSHLLLQILNRSTDMTPLLKEVLEGIKKFTDCAALGIRLLDDKGKIPYEAFIGFPEEFYKLESPLSLHSDRCMCINVIKGTAKPAFSFYTPGGSFYMNGTTRFLATVSEKDKGETRNICHQFGYESVALIPIRVEGSIIGAVHLADPRENLIPLRKIEILEDVALPLGMAIQRIKVEEQLKESEKKLRHLSSQLLAAQENERRRVARELHDGLGQSLTAIKYKVESFLQETRQSRMKSKAKPLEAIIPIIQEGVREIHRIQQDLRPSILDDLGILATLSWVCREFEATYPAIHIDRLIEMQESDVPDSLKMVIYRILQEALNNISKHSKAELVHLSLRKIERAIELSIQDNGRGFDVREAVFREDTRRGIGLSSMRERAEATGGTFFIESDPGKGTRIQVTWRL